TLASFAANTGTFTLLDIGNLTITGPVTGTNVSITTTGTGAISDTGQIAASGVLALSSGTGGIGIATTGIVTAPTIDLDGGGGAIALTGNALLGQTGATIDLTTTKGGVTEAATSTIIAATLHSAAGVTGAVDLAGTANAIGGLGTFSVGGGDFALVDTGDLAI